MTSVGTTIQLDKKVRDKLKELKIHPRESYNKVIERLMDIRSEEGELSKESIKSIERSLEDARAGRTITMNEVEKSLK